MRYKDLETNEIEARICALMGISDPREAEHVFESAWKKAREQQRLGLGRAKEIYLSILGTVIEKLNAGGSAGRIITLGKS